MENNQEFAIFFSDAPKGKKIRCSPFMDRHSNFARCTFCAGIPGEVSDTESKR